jgi:hypothetical protein
MGIQLVAGTMPRIQVVMGIQLVGIQTAGAETVTTRMGIQPVISMIFLILIWPWVLGLIRRGVNWHSRYF